MMTLRRFRAARTVSVTLALAVAAVLAVAACGSSGSSGGNSGSSGTTITTRSGPAGTYLANASGRAVYLFAIDSMNKSKCSGGCASLWPPVVAKGKLSASSGAVSSDLGSITRSDGTKQVTYKGHPLYYFSGDSGSGMTKGQGLNSFGGKWWLVAPSGNALTGSGSGATPSPPTSTGGGGWA